MNDIVTNSEPYYYNIAPGQHFLTDGLALIAIQCYYYSSYLTEKLDFNITLSDKILSLELFLNNEMSAQQVKGEIEKVLEHQKDNLRPVQELNLIWFFEKLNSREHYHIKLNQTHGHFSVEYESDTDSLFHDTFRNGAFHLKKITVLYFNQPDIPLCHYSIISEKEKEQIEHFSYGPVYSGTDFPELAHDIFENTVTKFAKNKSVQFHNESHTYKEINEKSNHLANFLYESGLREGDIAGILLNRSTDLYIAMLAVLKTGAAYLPLDLSYPAERIRYILDDSKARCLLSHSAYNQLFIGIKTKSIQIRH